MLNNYEYELIDHLMCTINTLLNPFHSSRIKGLNQSDVEQLENAVSVLEKLCFWNFENGEELIGAQTEDKAEPEEVPAEDEDEAKPEKFTCSYDFSHYTDCCSDDVLNPLSEDEIREFNSFVADHNALLIEHEVQSKDKEEPEEVPAQTEDKFSIYCFYEDGYRVAFPVRDKFYNYGLILHMYSNRFEFSNSELSSSTVLNVFNLDNNIHGDVLSICICPTVFDPEYTEPEEVPAEDEDEAEPEQVLSNKKCFSNAHCCTSDCPNIRFDIAESRFGYGIAEDMGFERISCKECYYNTGKCEDCLFFNGSECVMPDEIPF